MKDDASAIVNKVSGEITLEKTTEKIVLDFPAVEVAIQLEPIQKQLCFLQPVSSCHNLDLNPGSGCLKIDCV